MNNQEIQLIREEIEMLMQERANLLKVVGAAAALIAHSSVKTMPDAVLEDAEALSLALNALREETLKDALEARLSQAE